MKRDQKYWRRVAEGVIAALEAVKWVETEYDGTTYEICPWCGAQNGRPDEDHRPKCSRQVALHRAYKLGLKEKKS